MHLAQVRCRARALGRSWLLGGEEPAGDDDDGDDAAGGQRVERAIDSLAGVGVRVLGCGVIENLLKFVDAFTWIWDSGFTMRLRVIALIFATSYFGFVSCIVFLNTTPHECLKGGAPRGPPFLSGRANWRTRRRILLKKVSFGVILDMCLRFLSET